MNKAKQEKQNQKKANEKFNSVTHIQKDVFFLIIEKLLRIDIILSVC